MMETDCKRREETREADRLFSTVYDELRGMARRMMRAKRPGQTLQPTVLVHEAFLRLSRGATRPWLNRAHFFGAAAEAMRRILVEDARRKKSLRRGGQWERSPLDAALEEAETATATSPEVLVSVDEALQELANEHPLKVQVVELLFFAGLTVKETGEALGLSERTVKRHWAFARAWLYDWISEGG